MKLIAIFIFALIVNAEENTLIFTRENAWDCIMNVVDIDNDKAITVSEINAAKDKYMYWYEKVIGYLPFLPTVDVVMNDCDANRDGKVDATDYELKKLYCIPYNDPLKNWTVKSDALYYVKKFCDRAAGVLNKSVY